MKINRLILSVLLTFAVLASAIATTACPNAPSKPKAEAAITKAAKASFELSHLTTDAIRATKTAYDEQLITFEQKNALAEKLLVLARGGKAFNQLVKKAHETYSESGNLPPDELKLLEAAFDVNVLNPFLAFAASVGINASPKLKAAIETLRAAVNIIGAAFGRNSAAIKDRINPYARSHVTANFYGLREPV